MHARDEVISTVRTLGTEHIRRCAMPVVLGACVAVSSSCSGERVRDLTANDRDPTCESCSITRVTTVLLEDTGSAVMKSDPLAVTVNSGGHYLVHGRRYGLEFSPDGRLVRRRNWPAVDAERPRAIGAVTSAGTDSILIADNGAGLLRVMDARGTRLDSIFMPDNVTIDALHVVQWPGRLVFSGQALGRHGLFHAIVEDGYLIIDRNHAVRDAPAHVRAPRFRFASGADSTLWAAEVSSYTLHAFNGSGALVRSVTRDPGWFVRPSGGRPGGGLHSALKALSVDPAGRLWVYSLRPTDAANVAWRSPEARRPGGTVDPGPEELYETIVEVLDPGGNVLIARGRIAGYVTALLPDGRAMLVTGEDGTTRISIEDLQLTGYEG